MADDKQNGCGLTCSDNGGAGRFYADAFASYFDDFCCGLWQRQAMVIALSLCRHIGYGRFQNLDYEDHICTADENTPSSLGG